MNVLIIVNVTIPRIKNQRFRVRSRVQIHNQTISRAYLASLDVLWVERSENDSREDTSGEVPDQEHPYVR